MWYKMKARFGPGHQGKDFRYFWNSGRLSASGKQQIFEDAYRDRSWPIGSITLVRSLPKQQIDDKIHNLQNDIKRCKQMIGILERTPVRTTPDEEEIRRRKSKADFDKIVKQNRERMAQTH